MKKIILIFLIVVSVIGCTEDTPVTKALTPCSTPNLVNVCVAVEEYHLFPVLRFFVEEGNAEGDTYYSVTVYSLGESSGYSTEEFNGVSVGKDERGNRSWIPEAVNISLWNNLSVRMANWNLQFRVDQGDARVTSVVFYPALEQVYLVEDNSDDSEKVFIFYMESEYTLRYMPYWRPFS